MVSLFWPTARPSFNDGDRVLVEDFKSAWEVCGSCANPFRNRFEFKAVRDYHPAYLCMEAMATIFEFPLEIANQLRLKFQASRDIIFSLMLFLFGTELAHVNVSYCGP